MRRAPVSGAAFQLPTTAQSLPTDFPKPNSPLRTSLFGLCCHEPTYHKSCHRHPNVIDVFSPPSICLSYSYSHSYSCLTVGLCTLEVAASRPRLKPNLIKPVSSPRRNSDVRSPSPPFGMEERTGERRR